MLLVHWIGPYILIFIGILFAIGIAGIWWNKIKATDNKRNNNIPDKKLLKAPKNNSDKLTRKQQNDKLLAVINALGKSEHPEKNIIIPLLSSFQIQYLLKNNTNKSDLYDFILNTVDEKIKSTKNNKTKKDYKIILQIIQLLKNDMHTNDIICTISTTEKKEFNQNVIIVEHKVKNINNEFESNESQDKKTEKPANAKSTATIISSIIKSLTENAIHREDEKNINIGLFSSSSNISTITTTEKKEFNKNAITVESNIKNIINEFNSNEFQDKKIEKQENIKSITPIISSIIKSLIEHAIHHDENKNINMEFFATSIDASKRMANKFKTSKQDQDNDDACQIIDVPYWEHFYVYSTAALQNANYRQKKFYYYFKEQFLKGHYLDIKNNSNYVFVLMFDLADDYKIYKDFNLLKSQLDTLAKNYPIVAKYINRVLSKINIRNKQEIAKDELQLYDKSCGQLCQWITPGKEVDVQGIKLTRGNFYIGECFLLPDYIISNNKFSFAGYDCAYIYGSVLNPKLPISNRDICKCIFCSYKDMSLSWRYEYLMWLSGNKQAQDVSPDILLFYLYGCEIRMFIDLQTTEIERKNILEDIIQIYKSLNRTSSNSENSVILNQMGHFIANSIIKYFHNGTKFDITDILRNNITYQNFYISKKLAKQKELSPQKAFEIANEIFDIKQITTERYIQTAKQYFIDKFTEQYNNISINIEKITSYESIDYKYNDMADCYFCPEKVNLRYEIRNIPQCHFSIFNAIHNCYLHLENIFKTYNQEKKCSGGNETMIAILSLPNKINIKEAPKVQQIIALLENEMQSDKYIVKSIDWILSLWEYKREREKHIHKKYVDSIIEGLHRLNFGIVPNYKIDKKRFNFGDICVIYKNEGQLVAESNTQYDISVLFVKLASYIVHGDKATANDFRFVEQYLQSYNNTDGNYLHLIAYIRWRFLSKKLPIDKSSQILITKLTSEQRTSIGNALIKIACINRDIHPKRIECLKKILPLLDIRTDNIHSQIHRKLTDNDGFATIEKKSDAIEYSINVRPTSTQQASPKVIINPNKLRIFEQQTETAQKLLSTIFDDEEVTKPQDTISDDTSNAYIEILKQLFTKEIWKHDELEEICKNRGLMPGAVLEQINDFAYKKVDDTVIEDDGEKIYVTLEYKKQLI